MKKKYPALPINRKLPKRLITGNYAVLTEYYCNKIIRNIDKSMKKP